MQNKEIKETELGLKDYSKNTPPYIVALIIILTILFVSLFAANSMFSRVSYRKVKIGNTVYKLELADTLAKRKKGLSDREKLLDKTGMLFDFMVDGDWQIWMPRMNFPIDIVWLDKAGTVIFIKPNVQPNGYPEIYQANQLSRYVIELPAGDMQKTGSKVGDTIQL